MPRRFLYGAASVLSRSYSLSFLCNVLRDASRAAAFDLHILAACQHLGDQLALDAIDDPSYTGCLLASRQSKSPIARARRPASSRSGSLNLVERGRR